MYQRALILSKERPDVNLETVLSVPIIDILPASFREDGTKRRSTNKSDFFHIIEEKVSKFVIDKLNFSGITICIIDAMTEIQSLNNSNMKIF